MKCKSDGWIRESNLSEGDGGLQLAVAGRHRSQPITSTSRNMGPQTYLVPKKRKKEKKSSQLGSVYGCSYPTGGEQVQ